MYTSAQLLEKFNKYLSDLSYPTAPEGLYEPIAYALAMGGKRFRPVLLLLTYQLYRDDLETALPAAIGLETYHNHTLLHDDLMDKADLRRGMLPVYRKWDENTAILSGDTMLILAFKHVAACKCKRSGELLDLFLRTTREVCEGQQYDMNFEQRDNVSKAEYMEMIRLKTSVLVACAAQMGAIIADAPANDCTALYDFAERIGLAFQLQDDYLDVYGDPAVFGKKIGGDILCKKKTFLLISALETAKNEEREALLALLNDTSMEDEAKIAAVTRFYNTLGVGIRCMEAIEHHYHEAQRCLERIDLPEEKKRVLWDFAASLLNRRV